MAQTASGSRKSAVYATLGVPSPFDTSFSLVTSPVFSPLVLGVIRLTLAIYATAFILGKIIYEGIHFKSDGAFFSYFTTLSYIGLLSYLWAAAVQTLAYALSRRSLYPLQRWYRPLQFLHLLLQSTVITYPILVTIVFWALLSEPSTLANTYNRWNNISEHMLNTLFAAFEILLTNISVSIGFRPRSYAISMPWVHIPFVVFLLACYLGVAYITAGTQGFYTYSFLNPHREHAKLAAYIVGIAVAEIIIFIIIRYVCVLRSLAFARLLGSLTRDGALLRKGKEPEIKEEIDEWEEVERPSDLSAVSGSAKGIAV